MKAIKKVLGAALVTAAMLSVQPAVAAQITGPTPGADPCSFTSTADFGTGFSGTGFGMGLTEWGQTISANQTSFIDTKTALNNCAYSEPADIAGTWAFVDSWDFVPAESTVGDFTASDEYASILDDLNWFKAIVVQKVVNHLDPEISIEHSLGSWFGRDYFYAYVADFDNDPDGPPVSVPEPGSLALFALGMGGLVAARRRKQA